MKSKHFFPTTDDLFLQWSVSFLENLLQSLTRFNFPQDEYQRLVQLRDAYAAALAAAKNPATRTKAAVQLKNDTKKELENTLRQDIKEFLMFNRHVTDEDRDNLGLPIHDTKPTPIPPPAYEPEITFTTPSPAILEIHIRAKNEVGRAKPYGVHGAEVKWLLATSPDAPPPVDWDELLHSSFATRSPLRMTFNGYDRGKRLFFAARWENNRGEKGPWTEIFSAIVP
ncbi:MAG: hypothetical protein LBD91_06645 [Prevotellaceae bacterium]|jgi:hypothetical protein|nr:hypothetical protein [Prevotellaceae bacterium]